MAGVGSGPHLMGSSPGEGRVSLGLDLKESPLMGQKPTHLQLLSLTGWVAVYSCIKRGLVGWCGDLTD